ncbi:MAG: hypothetical protein ACREWJ_10615, partial [Rhodoferax sp.]
IAHAVVAQHVAVVPELLDEGVGVHGLIMTCPIASAPAPGQQLIQRIRNDLALIGQRADVRTQLIQGYRDHVQQEQHRHCAAEYMNLIGL